MVERESCVFWEDALVIIFGRIISLRIKTLCTVPDRKRKFFRPWNFIRSLCHTADRKPRETETMLLLLSRQVDGGARFYPNEAR